jgi:Flp pilus assembly secretin CpaC
MSALLRACAFALSILLTAIAHASAADQTIILTLGTGSMLVLERPFETVLIGDPNVVDVHGQNNNMVVLEPLRLGASELIFIDERSIAITNVRVLVCNEIRTEYRAGPDCQ